MRSSYLAYGLVGMVLASTLAVACGSDANKKAARSEDGGAGGAAGAAPSGDGGGNFEPATAGAGGEPGSGGNGGVPSAPTAGVGGLPNDEMGGAGGQPNTLPPLPAVNCDTITFKDAQLEAAVRGALDQAGEITPADALTLTDLSARDFGIVDLNGIECFTNLVSADFSGGEGQNPIVDIGPLSYLSKLTTLNLSVTKVADFSPLVYTTSLNTLFANDLSTLPDLTPLGQISSLQTLSINGGTLAVPASVSELHNISTLAAVSTIDDAALVGGLTQLHHLELGYMALTNADALGNLGNLNYLDVLDMGISSASPFATLTELSHLDLQEDPIISLLPLQNLTGLHELGLFAISATSIQPLVDNQGLSNGDSIDLSNVPLDCETQKANVTTLTGRGVTITGNPCP